MLGIQLKFQTCEKQKNRENKTRKEKQSHAQDSIYVVRQFAYVLGVARISLLSKKITMCGYNVLLSQKQQQDKTLITKKKNGFYIMRTGFTMGYKTDRVINQIKSCLTTIFHGIKFIHYHLYSKIPCNFLLIYLST